MVFWPLPRCFRIRPRLPHGAGPRCGRGRLCRGGTTGDRHSYWARPPRADAVFISCTALPTYDALSRPEERLGKPVISANQATAWALLDAVGERAHGPHQRLLA
ncbi:hypothetical protein [Streptomyces sp. NPDC057418]|uniref:aspartate racemase/maleate isomerase family protein n=1 Tax=Streptomyces sp. NPDC057418 TaxID=3346126 RepID=UPI0036C5D112